MSSLTEDGRGIRPCFASQEFGNAVVVPEKGGLEGGGALAGLKTKWLGGGDVVVQLQTGGEEGGAGA